VNALSPAPQPGRTCPLDYGYGPSVFRRDAELEAPALYVAGGLYGNLQALAAAEAMAAAEPGAVLVLNGDFHWFDADPRWFDSVEAMASSHPSLRGNVETEIARGVSGLTGCGCAYPSSVDEGTVSRSNAIIDRLGAAIGGEAVRERLLALPMHLVAEIGSARVAIVHGDAWSLAGWLFDRASLDDPRQSPALASAGREGRIDVFASTHTCSPVMRNFAFDKGRIVVANNGAAGMPNAAGQNFGIVTRIGLTATPIAPLYGTTTAGVHVDALPLAYDRDVFLTAFDACWPEASPAAISYRGRIVSGPAEDLGRAAPLDA
jgi:hypothetical protein